MLGFFIGSDGVPSTCVRLGLRSQGTQPTSQIASREAFAKRLLTEKKSSRNTLPWQLSITWPNGSRRHPCAPTQGRPEPKTVKTSICNPFGCSKRKEQWTSVPPNQKANCDLSETVGALVELPIKKPAPIPEMAANNASNFVRFDEIAATEGSIAPWANKISTTTSAPKQDFDWFCRLPLIADKLGSKVSK